MSTDLSRYIVNAGPKTPVTGLSAAVTTDSAIVTETIVKVLKKGGNAADAGIAGAKSRCIIGNTIVLGGRRSQALRGCRRYPLTRSTHESHDAIPRH